MAYTTGRKPWPSEAPKVLTDESRAVRQKLFYLGLVVFVVFAVLTLQLARRERLSALPGGRVVVQPRREYVDGPLLSHVLGFVGRIDEEEYARLRAAGYSLSDRLGKTGVELTYESV